MSIHVERLIAEVEAKTGEAERELLAFKAKAEGIIRSLSGEAKIDLAVDVDRDRLRTTLRQVQEGGRARIELDPVITGFVPRLRSLLERHQGRFPKARIELDVDESALDRLNLNRRNAPTVGSGRGNLGLGGDDDVNRRYGGLSGIFQGLLRLLPGVSRGLEGVGESASGAARGAGSLSGAAGGLSGVFTGMLAGLGSTMSAFTGLAMTLPMVALQFAVVGAAVLSLMPIVGGLVGSLVGLGSALGMLLPLLAAAPALLMGVGMALGAVMLAMKGMGEAFGAQQALNDKQAVSLAGVRNAGENVERALRSLADAQRNAKQAQEDLNEARERAAERLQDLRFQSRQLALSERGAVLALADAQKRLADINKGIRQDMTESSQVTDEFTGRIYDIARQTADTTSVEEDRARALLAVQQAELDLQRIREDRRRTDEDLVEAEAKGVEGSDEVVNALRRIEDANYAVIEAQRRLRDALEAQQEAMGKNQQAIDQYKQALEDLSPAAARFVEYIGTLRPKLDELAHAAQEGLFPGLQRGIEALMPLFDTLKQGIGDTATIIGDTFGDLGEMWGSGEFADIFQQLMEANTRMTETFGEALIDLSRGFGYMAEAAIPLAEDLTNWFAESSRIFGDWYEQMNKTGELGRIFSEAFSVFEDLMDIIFTFSEGIWNLIDLSKPIRDVWLTSMQQMGDEFLEFTRDGGALTEFFEALGPVTEVFFEMFKSVGTTLFDTFTALLPAAAAVGEALLPLLETLGVLLPMIAEAIGPSLGRLAELMSGFLSQAAMDLTPVLITAVETLVEVAGAFFDAMGPIITLASERLPGIMENVGDILVAFFGVFEDMANSGYLEAVFDNLANLVEIFSPVVVGLLESFGQVFIDLGKTGIFQRLSDGFERVMRQIARIIESGAPVFFELLTIGLETWLGIIESLLPVFEQLLTFVADLAEAWGERLLDFLERSEGPLGKLVEGFADLAEAFGDKIIDLLPELLPLFEDLMDVVIEFWEAGLEMLIEAMPDLVEAFGQLIESLPLMLELFVEFVPVLTELIEALLEPGPGGKTLLETFFELALIWTELALRTLPILIGIMAWMIEKVLIPYKDEIIEIVDKVIWFMDQLELLIDWLGDVKDTMRDVIETALKPLATAFNAVKDFVEEMIDKFQELKDWIDDNDVFGSLLDTFREVIRSVIEIWNGLEFTIGKQEVFGRELPGVTIGTPNINPDDLPGFHQGGIFRAPLGEHEGYAKLLDGERILSPAETRDYNRSEVMMGGIDMDRLEKVMSEAKRPQITVHTDSGQHAMLVAEQIAWAEEHAADTPMMSDIFETEAVG